MGQGEGIQWLHEGWEAWDPHIPEYQPHPSHCRSARGPGLRTGRCPPRGTSPYKELVSPKVPGQYGGQHHGCSSKLQNSVKFELFLWFEQRKAPRLRTSHPVGREEASVLWDVKISLQRPDLQGATFWLTFLLPNPPSPTGCSSEEGPRTPTEPHSALTSSHLCKLRQLQAAVAISASQATWQ